MVQQFIRDETNYAVGKASIKCQHCDVPNVCSNSHHQGSTWKHFADRQSSFVQSLAVCRDELRCSRHVTGLYERIGSIIHIWIIPRPVAELTPENLGNLFDPAHIPMRRHIAKPVDTRGLE